MRKTIFWLVVIMVLILSTVNALAGAVTDDNNGTSGYIFVSTGKNSGQSSEGHWTNPSTLLLKGDKGDTGSQGIAGYTPIKGVDYFDGMNGINGVDGIGIDGKDGLNGINGIDGYTPIKGVDYFDGLNGNDGLSIKGDQGIAGENGKDVDPLTVTNLQNTDNTLQENINIEQFDRIKLGNDLQYNISNETTNRVNTNNKLQDNINSANSKIDDTNNRVSKLEKTQINIRTEVKFMREKHLEMGIYTVYSTTRNTMAEVGLNVVVPIGESYQDREAKRVNMRLNKLEKQMGNSAIIEKTLDNKGNIKSISISSSKVAFGGEF